MNILEKMKKSGSLESYVLKESLMYQDNDVITTEIPILNVALSGEVNGGMTPGLTVIAGVSRNYKTGLGLHLVKAFQKKHKDSVIIFYDSEFGTPLDYFKKTDCNMENILHIPIHNIEELKFDIIKKLESIERKDNVMIFVDSIGNLASKKEIDDAKDERSVADLSRAKQVKSFFRMVTPYLQTKNIPMVVIAHTYDTMDFMPKKVISGGSGILYSANTCFIMGRQQDKEGTNLKGYNFVINVEKSRLVKEKSKVSLTISFENGIDKYSGIKELAIEAGYIIQSGSWFQIIDTETGEISEKKIRGSEITNEYLDFVLQQERFKRFVEKKFKINYGEEYV